ncbi:LytTR family DNA-binding domain-containing protein [Lutibacter sp.]|uniref:LytR/AlgR family response regulator transcription factor n=1 Tax=Lutibacter sp. TaxID=1925666 RepID=UPI0025BB962D|nr:LytTR family DNA-binding domain-containing protein [Lutibacter sp.]MCF6181612.1 LytTR family DNA-binding domain-containing protein [Lutibacter sp.]
MKTKINAIIIDDEKNALESLALKIAKYFPQIAVTHKFQNPQKAVQEINQNHPDLVFIDIEMPILSGFDVLSKIENPNFEIIFVTAYSEYAIDAIKHCAIGYIIKPIDNDELQSAIENALKNINQKSALEKNQQLLQNLVSNGNSTIVIPTQKGLSLIKTADIIRFEGIDGYTKIILENANSILSSYSIGKFNNIASLHHFYLVHKSHFINLNYINEYLNEGYIIMDNNDKVPISKAKRTSFLEKIKNI